MMILYGLKHVGVCYFDISNSKKTYCAFSWLLKILSFQYLLQIQSYNVGSSSYVHFFNLAKCNQVMSILEYIL
jgi:hypothetical protein